jgi:hypothetical protein
MNIYVDESPHAKSAQASLLHTSRLLRAETKYILGLLAEEPYELDVMFVMGCGLIPTWVSCPGLKPEVFSVDIDIRMFDMPGPDDVDSSWFRRGDFGGGERRHPPDGDDDVYEFYHTDPTSWSLMALFNSYLLGQCWNPRAAGGLGVLQSDEAEEGDQPQSGALGEVSRPRRYCRIRRASVSVTAESLSSLDGMADAHVTRDVFGSSAYIDILEIGAGEWLEGTHAGEAQTACAYALATNISRLGDEIVVWSGPFNRYTVLLHTTVAREGLVDDDELSPMQLRVTWDGREGGAS